MVSKPIDPGLGGNDHSPDEGWWSSVLADEESFSESPAVQQPKVTSHPVLPKVEWDQVQAVFEKDEVVSLLVYGYNRGGLLVQGVGIQGFVPISHLINVEPNLNEEDRKQLLSCYVGKTIQAKVIECEPSQERIVLSERAAQAGEGTRKNLFRALKSGDLVVGTVTNITEFGVFVDLGGLEGLIHVSELSWGRVQHPLEIVKVGQKVQTMILQVNEESSRVALSLKRLQPNPWEILPNRYKAGDIVPATITCIMRFGAFAHLEEGIEGLIHISSMALPTGVRDLEKVLKTGQKVKVRILHIDIDRRRLGLGLVASE